MFETTIAGSLPKPAWLAETNKLWPQWKAQGAELAAAKRDATLLWLKLQEDAGLDIVSDGEQSRQHFVHGFLEAVAGIDFEHKVEMGIRNDRYKAMVPQVVGPLSLKRRVHETEARLARAHTKRTLKFTLPGPMTIVDTVADLYYGDRKSLAFAFADLLNQEARALEADGVDIIQFDEPAFNVYMKDVNDWGIAALERAAAGLTCTTAVHICYGYGIAANIDWKKSLGDEWRQYEQIFPALAKSSIRQVSLECANSHVPIELIRLLEGKDVMVGVIDVASDTVETPEQVADTIGRALQFVPKNRLLPCTNCGMAPMDREIARRKLEALAQGAALARALSLSRFLGTHLGGDVVAVRDVQQFGDPAHQVVLARRDLGVRVGHLPHQLDHLLLLLLREVAVDQRSELEVIGGLTDLLFGQPDQLIGLGAAQPELLVHRAQDRGTLVFVCRTVAAGHLDQHRRGRQLDRVPRRGRSRTGEIAFEEVTNRLQHGRVFPSDRPVGGQESLPKPHGAGDALASTNMQPKEAFPSLKGALSLLREPRTDRSAVEAGPGMPAGLARRQDRR
jgi:5-methyltetrahydropteroyltriglutamate--homocysteine methyltransferase